MRPNHVLSALAGLALISSDYVSAWFMALTEDSPVVVAVGDMAVLRCRTSVAYELTEVRWIRTYDGQHYLINVYHDGRDQQICDRPEYIGRTEMIREDLAHGKVSLKLFNVSVADEGTYRCYLETVHYLDIGDLELSVTALGSVPKIDIGGFQDGGVKAVCRSSGWYPKPVLEDKDDDGEMEIRQEENGLYSTEYSRIITENSNRTFSCRLRTLFPNQDRAASVYFEEGLVRNRTHSVVIVACFMAAVLGLLLGAEVALYLRRRQRHHQDAFRPAALLHNKKRLPASRVCASTATDDLYHHQEAFRLSEKERELEIFALIWSHPRLPPGRLSPALFARLLGDMHNLFPSVAVPPSEAFADYPADS